jgi:hypothetical protein
MLYVNTVYEYTVLMNYKFDENILIINYFIFIFRTFNKNYCSSRVTLNTKKQI